MELKILGALVEFRVLASLLSFRSFRLKVLGAFSSSLGFKSFESCSEENTYHIVFIINSLQPQRTVMSDKSTLYQLTRNLTNMYLEKSMSFILLILKGHKYKSSTWYFVCFELFFKASILSSFFPHFSNPKKPVFHHQQQTISKMILI